jgi:hypothetical protein
MHNIYYSTILDVIIQCELGRVPGGQTSLPDNNLLLVYVNDINPLWSSTIIILQQMGHCDCYIAYIRMQLLLCQWYD